MSEVQERVLEVVANETGKPVGLETPLESLEMDSLDFLNLMLALRERVGPIEDSEFPELATVGDLVRHYRA